MIIKYLKKTKKTIKTIKQKTTTTTKSCSQNISLEPINAHFQNDHADVKENHVNAPK